MLWTTNSTRKLLVALLAACFAVSALAKEATVEELKERVKSAAAADRPRICVQIAERQLETLGKSFAADESEKAHTSLSDVVTYSELARDSAIQSGKHQKQTEIAVRTMARKLNDLKHGVPHDEQPAIQAAMDRLQKVRDDLLQAMFPHGKKGGQ
jgi:uncharacterized radical SAM superfamily Fe-S cluster-containing enzyme